jgi:hypothetical protein
MYQLRRAQPRNTALRFRFNTLYQRYTTLQSYWSRVSRQIEEGTYRRDVMRARKRREEAREARQQRRKPQDPAHDLDIDVELDELDVDAEVRSALAAATAEQPASSASRGAGGAEPSAAAVSREAEPSAAAASRGAAEAEPSAAAAPPAPRPSATAAAPAPSTGRATQARFGKPTDPFAPRASGVSRAETSDDEARLRRLYQQYLEARRRNNERTDNIIYEKLARRVREMEAKQKDKHGGKKVDFQVVVRNGKVGLKPVTGE